MVESQLKYFTVAGRAAWGMNDSIMNEPSAGPSPSSSHLPPASAPPSRTWEVLCHVSALAGYIIPFGNIIGPLVVWLMKKAESAEVDYHGKEALNFQISVAIYAIVGLLLVLVVIGIPLLIALGIANLVFMIIAAIKASNGERYRYPCTIRFVK